MAGFAGAGFFPGINVFFGTSFSSVFSFVGNLNRSCFSSSNVGNGFSSSFSFAGSLNESSGLGFFFGCVEGSYSLPFSGLVNFESLFGSPFFLSPRNVGVPLSSEMGVGVFGTDCTWQGLPVPHGAVPHGEQQGFGRQFICGWQ